MTIALGQVGRLATVGTVLGADAVVLERMTATERLGEPFTIVVDVTSRKLVDFLPILGTGVNVAMLQIDGVSRDFHGLLFEAAAAGDSEAGSRYRLVLRPWTSLLGLGLNTRLWQDKSPKDIIKDVFDMAGMSGFRFALNDRGMDPRSYCVQYRESDWNFVSRLMEEEGIYYFWEHTAQKHTLVLCDGPDAHAPAEGLAGVDYYPAGESDRPDAHFWDWSEQVRPGAQKVSLRDSSWMSPTQSKLAVHELSGDGANDVAEIYDYPGGFASSSFKDDGTQAGKPYATARLLAARAERRRFNGAGTAFAIGAGRKFKLGKHEEGRFNVDYLVVGATHALSNPSYVAGGDEGANFEVQIEAIPLTTRWAPALKTPKPIAGGPQTAIVVGPDEAKGIHVDEYGRVKVKFYWDRRDKLTDGSPVKPDHRSCWIRVSQAWAGAGYGAINIPRVGHEVLVDFIDGDPDQPIIVGRVYNKDSMPPHKLHDNKTKSTWKSETVGDAGSYSETEEPPPASDKGFNEIGFEDKGGDEQIFMHAQRDLVTWVRHDESHKVGHNVKVRVGYNRETEIKKNETITVETGDETRTIKAGSRKTVINKADELKIEQGDKKLEVSMGNWANQVKMGNYTLKCDLGKVTVEAMQEIELKVGGSSIKIDQMGVTVKGMMVKVDASMMLEAKAGAMGTLDGGAMLTVKGGLVLIN